MSRTQQTKDRWQVGSLVIASVWSDSRWVQCQSLIRYAGPTLFEELSDDEPSSDFYYGLELLEKYSRCGNCDGMRNGFRYFNCAPNAGLFVKPSKIKRIMNAKDFAMAEETLQKVKRKKGRPRSAESVEERKDRHSRTPSLQLSSVNPALNSEDECRVDIDEETPTLPRKRSHREPKPRLKKRRSLAMAQGQAPPPPPSRPPPPLASSASSSSIVPSGRKKGRSRALTSSSKDEMESRSKRKQRSAETPKWDPKTYSFATTESSDEPFGFRVSRRSSYNAGAYKSDIRSQLRAQSKDRDENSGSLSDHPPAKAIPKKRSSITARRKSKVKIDCSPPLKKRKSVKKGVGSKQRQSSAGESSPGPALVLSQSESSGLIHGADDTWFEADLFDTDASSLTNEDMERVFGMVMINTPLADSDSDDSDKVDDRYTSPFSLPVMLTTDSEAEITSFAEPLAMFSQSLGELGHTPELVPTDSPTKRSSSLRRDSKSREKKKIILPLSTVERHSKALPDDPVPKKRRSLTKKSGTVSKSGSGGGGRSKSQTKASKRRNSTAETDHPPTLKGIRKKSGTPKLSQTPRVRNTRKKPKVEPSTAPTKRTGKRKGSVSKGSIKSISKSSSTDAKMVEAPKAIQPPTKISTPRKKPLKKRKSLLKTKSVTSIEDPSSNPATEKKLKASVKEKTRIAAEESAHPMIVDPHPSSEVKTRKSAKSETAMAISEVKTEETDDGYSFSLGQASSLIKAFPTDARSSASMSQISVGQDGPDSAKTHKSTVSAASEPTHVRRLSKLSAVSAGSSISDDSLLSDSATHRRSNTFDDIRANLFLMRRESNDIAETWDMVTAAGPSTPGIHDLLEDEADSADVHSTGFFFSHAFDTLDQES